MERRLWLASIAQAHALIISIFFSALFLLGKYFFVTFQLPQVLHSLPQYVRVRLTVS